MTPDIEHIMTYIKVVELGSFTAAAHDLNVSKSVVSKHVSTLEESLNAKLLQRTTRKLSVTDVGQVFYDQVKNIPYAVKHAQQAIQPFSEEPNGLLRVISPTDFLNLFESDVVPNYLMKYPKVQLSVRDVRPVEEHLNDDFDIIVLWKFDYENFPDYNMVPIKLLTLPIGIYISEAYIEEHGCPTTPHELKDHNCFSSAGDRWPFVEKDQSPYLINVNGTLHSQNDQIVRAACTAGVGIAYSSPFIFEEDVKAGRVRQILQDYTNIQIEVYAFYHPTPYMPRKISAFIEEMKAYYHQFVLSDAV